jgi:hypothetical protein
MCEDSQTLDDDSTRLELAKRIELENTLLNSRTGHLLAVHGFLVTALAILTGNSSSVCLPWFRSTICWAGVVLGLSHLLVGYGTMLSIRYWSRILDDLEKRMNRPGQSRFNANLNYTHVGFKVALVRLVNWVIAAIFPIGLIIFWGIAWVWVMNKV